MCVCLCLQQVDECYRESGVGVDSLWNVSDLCLCVHMNTRSHTDTHRAHLLLPGWDGAAGRSEGRRAVVFGFRCPIGVWQLTLTTAIRASTCVHCFNVSHLEFGLETLSDDATSEIKG